MAFLVQGKAPDGTEVALKVAADGSLVTSGGAGTALIGKVGIDQTTPGTTDSVSVKSTAHSASATITRPNDATAYAAGDVVGDVSGSAIIEFANVAPAGGGQVLIVSIEYAVDVAAVPAGMTGFNVHLYNATPTAIADNAVFTIPTGDRSKYLGKVTLGTPVNEGLTLFSNNDSLGKQITLTGTSLFVELQTVGGYTPTASAVKRLTLHVQWV